MQGKNARQNVQDVCNQLQTCVSNLSQALTTAEKQENKQKIQSTLNAVNNALQTANNTLTSYKE